MLAISVAQIHRRQQRQKKYRNINSIWREYGSEGTMIIESADEYEIPVYFPVET
jgi:hypothetical protein